MVSFEGRLAQGLAQRQVEVCYSLDDKPYQAVLVIGGLRDLAGLRRARREGARLVQRLDGMNWLHRKRRTGLKHYLRAEYGNFILAQIRKRLAMRIVYQSRFSKEWWERAHGPTPVPCGVVYNGVDLQQFHPDGLADLPQDRYRLLMVEGTLGGGYETGLETAIQLVHRLSDEGLGLKREIELTVAGRVDSSLRKQWLEKAGIRLTFTGQVPPEGIAGLDRSAHLLYSADLNAACPNSAIEALACGLPVIAFDTGALPELVAGDAGRIVPYGGNSWNLDPPEIAALANAAREVLLSQEKFRPAARRRAEQVFGLDQMVDGYVDALLG